jgi:hypothetical protein
MGHLSPRQFNPATSLEERMRVMLNLVILQQDTKKTMRRRIVHPQEKTRNQTGQHLGSDRTAQAKDGDVVDPEPASDATKAGSIQRPGNASRKRMLRSRCN